MKNSYTSYKIQNTRYKFRAQSLLELLVGITVGTILIGGSVTLTGLSLRVYYNIRQHLQANLLVRQAAELIVSLSRDNWHNIYDSKGSNYKITASSTTWIIESGQEESTINNIPYKRYFQVTNVNRNTSGDIVTSGGSDDPSTQKITIFLEYGNNYISSSSLPFYLTRFYNSQVFQQTDWSGGGGVTGPAPNPGLTFATSSNVTYSVSGQITLATSTDPGYLISSILDTGITGGAGFNSLIWQGSGSVSFQIAFSSTSSSTWNYYGANGANDYYQPNSSTSVAFPTTGTFSPQNNRYIRYAVYLGTSTPPIINDIIINWTP